ncbi:hypothetical protein OF83DRAFT_1283982 [Amylostereum chailletii]|nr:hypothetical protein OF83DRAFT_1283982 [Amylostereum chailletii]
MSLIEGLEEQVKHTYGSISLGVYASVGFLGITTLQCWLYYLNYPNDSKINKLMVATIWILEFVRNCFAVHAMYHYLVLNWGNPLALLKSVWSIDVNLLLTAIVQAIVHGYFTWRIYRLSLGNWYITSLIILLAFANFAMSIATYGATISADFIQNIEGVNKLPTDFSTAALSSSIAADLEITCSLVYYLNRNRTEDEYKNNTDAILTRLIFYAVNIGVLTSLADIGVLILSPISIASPPHSAHYYALYEVVGNFYANSLLTSLNARKSLSKKYDQDVHMSTLEGQVSDPTITDLSDMFPSHHQQTRDTILISANPDSDTAGFHHLDRKGSNTYEKTPSFGVV